jgi:hypothetical protein
MNELFTFAIKLAERGGILYYMRANSGKEKLNLQRTVAN